MKKWFTGLYTLLGLAALAALTVLLIVLFSRAKNPVQVGQVTSPVGMPTMTSIPSEAEVAFQSPIQSPAPTSTAPSEDWPTLTPPPTPQSPPTRTGTPSVKKVTQTPIATRPRLLLSPTPSGKMPDNTSSLYYVGDNTQKALPELRQIKLDSKNQRWEDKVVFDNIITGDLLDLLLSPDGQYIATYTVGRGGPGTILVANRISGQVWCPIEEPIDCQGGLIGWTPNNQLLIFPAGADGGIWQVDIQNSKYQVIDLPIDPVSGFSLVRNISFSPDGHRMAYSLVYTENYKEISEIWIKTVDGQDKKLVFRMEGSIYEMSWSPTDDLLLCWLQTIENKSSNDPSELWLLSADGNTTKLLTDNIRWGGASFRRSRPVWSPKGRYIAVVQVDDIALFLNNSQGAGTNVFVIDTAENRITQLSDFASSQVGFVTWSPGGESIAFLRNSIAGEEIANSEVWIASIDASQLVAVSNAASPYHTIAWFPPLSGNEGEK